jgi:hypothetical protein
MVPKKGLEPPHPCEYMDLNHARLPIPPLRHLMCARQTPALRREYTSILKGLWDVSNGLIGTFWRSGDRVIGKTNGGAANSLLGAQ